MNRRLILAASLAAAALAPATPALASSSHPTGTAAVSAHAAKAAAAGRRASFLARTGHATAAAAAVTASRREAITASHLAQGLVPDAATSCAAADEAITALTTAAQAFGTATQQLAALTGRTDGSLQSMVAGSIPGSIAGHTQLVDVLTTLTQQLQGECQAFAAQALAAVQAAAPGQLSGLAALAGTGGLPVDVSGIIGSALAAATQALDNGLPQLSGLLPALPPAAQAQITMALGLAQQQLAALQPLVAEVPVAGPVAGQVLQLVSSLLGTLGTSVTGTTGATAAGLPGIGSISALLNGILAH